MCILVVMFFSLLFSSLYNLSLLILSMYLCSLAKSEDENWSVMDDSDPLVHRKFYINVCRPLTPIKSITGPGCDFDAAACETFIGENGVSDLTFSPPEVTTVNIIGSVQGRLESTDKFAYKVVWSTNENIGQVQKSKPFVGKVIE